MSLECGNAACRKALMPPFLQCAKCKAAAYCSKACQTTAWKTGHKRECAPGQGAAAALIRRAAREAARPAPSAQAGLTRGQRRLWTRLGELQAAHDWRGIVALETEALALARDLRGADPGAAGAIHGVLGLGFEGVGQYTRALALLAEAKAISEALGDCAGVAKACCGLGICYQRTGEYARAIALHAEHKAMAEALGDRAGVARACGNLGNCYESTGEYARAIALHAEHRAISEALGDRAGVAAACGNLGNCYQRTGEYARALALHAEDKAISEALGDRAGVAAACGNLGNCYQRTGEYARALALHAEDKAIAEALGDRAGVVAACSNLGNCYQRTGEYARAIALHAEDKAISEALGDCAGMARACANLGVCYQSTGEYCDKYARALSLHVEAKAISEALGDRAGVASACGNIGAGIKDLVATDSDCNELVRFLKGERLSSFAARFSDVMGIELVENLRKVQAEDLEGPDFSFLRPWHKQKLMELVQLTPAAGASLIDSGLDATDLADANTAFESCDDADLQGITAGSADWHQTRLSECIQLEKDSVAGSLSVDDSDLAGAPWTTAISGADTAFKRDDFVSCDDADLSFATVLAKHPGDPGSPGCFANTVADFQEHMAGFVRDFLAYIEAGVEADDEWNTYDIDLGNTGTRRWTWCMLLWIQFARDASRQLDESLLCKWLEACSNLPSQGRFLELLTWCLLSSTTPGRFWSCDTFESLECKKQHAASIFVTDAMVQELLERHPEIQQMWSSKIVGSWFCDDDETADDFLLRANRFLRDHNRHSMCFFARRR